jgi:hypothetical protein
VDKEEAAMKNVFIEVTNGPQNWGKFMVAQFDDEWRRGSKISESRSLLRTIGWGANDIVVFDLQTLEGAAFSPHGGHGNAHCDLEKHKVWVCPMFEPFLAWLYKQDLSDLDKLPNHVDLPDAPFAMHGYRREGK